MANDQKAQYDKAKKTYGWLIAIILDQEKAYTVQFFFALVLSSPFIWGLSYAYDILGHTAFWMTVLILFALPQYFVFRAWKLGVKPQRRAELVIRKLRTGIWLSENDYSIPFYGWLVSVFVEKIQKTGKTDETKAFSYYTQDINGELLYVQTDAERKIVDPTTYSEYNDLGLAIDEEGLLTNAGIRKLITLDFKTEIAGKDIKINDHIYNMLCNKYGISFDPVVLTVKLADPTSDTLGAKYKRQMKELVAEYRIMTGKNITDPLTFEEIKSLSEKAEMMIKLPTTKTIYDGLGGKVTPIKPV